MKSKIHFFCCLIKINCDLRFVIDERFFEHFSGKSRKLTYSCRIFAPPNQKPPFGPFPTHQTHKFTKALCQTQITDHRSQLLYRVAQSERRRLYNTTRLLSVRMSKNNLLGVKHQTLIDGRRGATIENIIERITQHRMIQTER